MLRGSLAVGAAALLLAFPALADPGPHDHKTAGELVAHFLSDGFHVAHIVALLGAVFAGLGVLGVIRAARSGFRR